MAAKHAIVKIGRLIFGEKNTRTVDPKSEKFQDLLMSIKAEGVKVPLMVREIPDADPESDKLEIMAGEHRFEASKLAGLETIPVVIYDGMDDLDAFKVKFFENYARRELNVIEEAEAVGRLLHKSKDDFNSVGSSLGWSAFKVRKRANLLNLVDRWKKWAIVNGSGMAGHLEEIARLPKITQENLYTRWSDQVQSISLKEFQRQLSSDNIHSLSLARFDLNDEKLAPAAGSCENCPKRSDRSQAELFEDLTKGQKSAVCLDGQCFSGKTATWLKAQADAAGAKTVNFQQYDDDYQFQRILNAGGLQTNTIYREKIVAAPPKGKEKSYKAVFMGSGQFAGKVAYVQTGASNGDSSRGNEMAKPKTMAEKKAGLEKRRWAEVARILSDDFRKLGASNWGPGVGPKGNPDALLKLALFDRIENHSYGTKLNLFVAATSKTLLDIPANALKAAHSVLVQVISKRFMQSVEDGKYDFIENVSSLLGRDADGLYKKVVVTKGFTVPKSWTAPKPEEKKKAVKTEKKAAKK